MPRCRIGVRVLGSWLVASALMVLVLTWSGPRATDRAPQAGAVSR